MKPKAPEMDCHPSEAFKWIKGILLKHLQSHIEPDTELVELYNFVDGYNFVTWG